MSCTLAEAAVLAGRCQISIQPYYSLRKYLFFKKIVFSMVVPSLVLVHAWRVEGSVCSTDDYSPIQAPALCWGRCKIRDFPPTAAG